MSILEVKVPDIGDYRDVPITEVLVKPGDSVAAEDPLITLESDKAALDIPAPADRLRQVRSGADATAVAHQEIIRRKSASQLVEHPARDAARRGRHHRARGVPQVAGR